MIAQSGLLAQLAGASHRDRPICSSCIKYTNCLCFLDLKGKIRYAILSPLEGSLNIIPRRVCEGICGGGV